jgi:TPR repeat protein
MRTGRPSVEDRTSHKSKAPITGESKSSSSQEIKRLLRLAEKGDLEAQTTLGEAYCDLEQYPEAIKWFRKAAAKDWILAQIAMGDMYYDGLGVQQNYEKAVDWYRKAAEQGDSEGEHSLGEMYRDGLGVTQDFAEAFIWYKRAAEKGSASAQNSLALMYELGAGVPQDYGKAQKWYARAAEKGEPFAQYNLGLVHLYGLGISADHEEALRWFRKSAEQDNEDAKIAVEHLEIMERQFKEMGIGDRSKYERVAKLLLRIPRSAAESPEFWGWIVKGQEPSKKDANKFFLACIIDYRMSADLVWENVRKAVEEKMRDPEKLWEFITSFSEKEWSSKKKEYALHWLTNAHMRAWYIGNDLVTLYDGDARKIWQNQTPNTVYDRLQRLGKHGAGENISNMIIGALLDTGQIKGMGDVKADTHVRRVLGRVFFGTEFKANESSKVVELARTIFPENPWLLDQPLYFLGGGACDATNPNCRGCYLRAECSFFNKGRRKS